MLPKTIEPIRLGKLSARLEGDLSLKNLSRLQEMGDQGDEQAHVEMEFGQDAAKLYYIRGKIKATVKLICQRCNSPMAFDLESVFSLSPVVSEERAKNLPSLYEPVFMQDEIISVNDMIEDEILLALPMVPKHEDKACSDLGSCSQTISC